MLNLIKENKKITGSIIFIIIVIPIIVNFIAYCPAPFPKLVVGKSEDWLRFFTTFLGTLVGALVSFLILYMTMKQNHQESEKNRVANQKQNEENRKLQTAIINYQIAKDGFETIKKHITQYQSALNIFDLYSMKFYYRKNKDEVLKILRDSFKEEENAYSNLLISLIDKGDKEEVEFLNYLQLFGEKISKFYLDLIWFLNIWDGHPNEQERIANDKVHREFFIKEVNLRKESLAQNDSECRYDGICKYIEKHDYNILSEGDQIIYELLINVGIGEFNTKAYSFCGYEKEKIEKEYLESIES